MIIKAFSLIELMVVVAIIAVLAAIAVPSFQQYYARGQVSAILPIAQGIMQNLQQYYAVHGSFPNSYVIGGTSFPGNGTSWAAVSGLPNISNAYYMVSSDGLGTGIGLNFTSLLIPTFSQGTNGNYSNIFFGMRANSNGVFTTVCGQNGAGGTSSTIPLQYMPSICTCAFVGAGWTSGYISTGTGC